MAPQIPTLLHFLAPLQVRDQEIPVKRNFVKVVVHVEDYNDHSPAFLSPRYEASISNLAPKGSEVVRVKALDKDMGSNAEISYSLHSGEQQRGYFSLLFMPAPFQAHSVSHIHIWELPPFSNVDHWELHCPPSAFECRLLGSTEADGSRAQ